MHRPLAASLILLASATLAESPSPPLTSNPAPTLPDSAEALAEGAAIFERRCSQCHGLDGRNYKGPWLNGILGRPAGAVPDWDYSDAMRAAGHIWTIESLQAWLTRPQEFVPDTAMNFGGFRSRIEDRDKVIAWLIAQPADPAPSPGSKYPGGSPALAQGRAGGSAPLPCPFFRFNESQGLPRRTVRLCR